MNLDRLVRDLFVFSILLFLTVFISACKQGTDLAGEDALGPSLTVLPQLQVAEGDTAEIVFSLSNTTSHDVTFDYQTQDASAVQGSDYQAMQGTLSIEKGEREIRLAIQTLENSEIKSISQFKVQLSNVEGATLDELEIEVSIEANSGESAVEAVGYGFIFSQTQASFQAGKIDIALQKFSASNEAVIVPFKISGSAISGEEYQLEQELQVVFDAQQTLAIISISILDNGLPKSGSVITIELLSLNGIELASQPKHNVIIAGGLALNDTGATTGNDALYGRDFEMLGENNDGEDGFSFTKLDRRGNKLAYTDSESSCVLDNVTGKVYEAKQYSGYTSASVYNAKLTDSQINSLGGYLSAATYEHIHTAFPADFKNIIGKEYQDSEKNIFAFKRISELENDELRVLFTSRKNHLNETLAYPFNAPQEILHGLWRNNAYGYYWLNESAAKNGGRSGTEGGFSDSGFPLASSCAFPNKNRVNYVEGLKGCNSRDYLKVMNDLALCGFNDWRLPQIEELRSIVNYDLSSLRWDSNFFPNTFSASYLSATTSIDNNASVWCVDAVTGTVNFCHKQLPNLIRAVRGK
jgi:hypothetical protein